MNQSLRVFALFTVVLALGIGCDGGSSSTSSGPTTSSSGSRASANTPTANETRNVERRRSTFRVSWHVFIKPYSAPD